VAALLQPVAAAFITQLPGLKFCYFRMAPGRAEPEVVVVVVAMVDMVAAG
jgi:hypothetical protein